MLSTQNISKIFKKYIKNWKKRTKSLPSPWPKDGTFDVVAFENMEQRIKDHKPGNKSKKRQEKRELWLKVLNLLENEGVTFYVLIILFSGSLLCFQVLFHVFRFQVIFLSCIFPCHLVSFKSPVFCSTAAPCRQSPPHSI